MKVKRYSVNSWPPEPETYVFSTLDADQSACEEVLRIETNDKCSAYQHLDLCPRPSRFETQNSAETVSPGNIRFRKTLWIKHMAPPCEQCWEKEDREWDIRTLIDNITKYDLADVATLDITGTNGEFQEAIADICIESQCPAEANFMRSVVKQAIKIRQRQIASCTSRLCFEWRQGEEEELVATLNEFIKRQTVE